MVGVGGRGGGDRVVKKVEFALFLQNLTLSLMGEHFKIQRVVARSFQMRVSDAKNTIVMKRA